YLRSLVCPFLLLSLTRTMIPLINMRSGGIIRMFLLNMTLLLRVVLYLCSLTASTNSSLVRDHELLWTEIKDLHAHIERNEEVSAARHIVLVALITGLSQPTISFIFSTAWPIPDPSTFYLLIILSISFC
ncbi:hypothetical protein HAX54_022703, partial [Datura stramonium]|nr:hypothetical protein [Datura stramonium]